MNRRELLRATAALCLTATLAACGGGSTSAPTPPAPNGPRIDGLASDKTSYFVGDQASLTATFSGGTGRIEPGAIAVTSGVPVAVGPLLATTTYRLVVTSGQTQVTRDLALPTAYRNRFTPVAMNFARSQHQAVELPNGRVLVIGGDGAANAAPVTVMSYDPQANTFAQAGTVLTGRMHHSATALADGTVLIVGGSRTLQGTPVAERFDPATGTSRATATQPLHSRSLHTATLLADGRVLFVGGLSSGGNAAANTVDVFDPATEQFTRLPGTLAATRYGHATVRVTADKLVIYGGSTVSGQAAAPEVFDVQTMASSASTLPQFDAAARLAAAVVKTSAGDFAVIGGESPFDSAAASKVALIAGGTVAFNDGGQLLSPRTLHAAAALVDGRVLVTGGSATLGTTLASSELYTPSGRVSVAGPAMTQARAYHTATRLSNGKVLIIGGTGANGLALASAELYE
ncbi:Kelch repeat-containing protein [Pseudoduganella sp. GCM10020061]|uniref:Kelch repeat-containing protein n=1 Tax=Pseudoduganella sp. GCM10020061 TaxID=3317345 RepID=UPI003637CBD5